MISPTRFLMVPGLAVMLMIGAAAHADVEVTVTISGNLDEIIPILELLRDMGIGAETLGEPGEGLRLNMHSVSAIESAPDDSAFEAVPPAPVDLQPAEPVVVVEPTPALADLTFTPAPVAPGAEVLITVAVTESDKNVDTIVAQIDAAFEESFDLYDNGTHGDQAENDGTWSAVVMVPETTNPGGYKTTVTAYDPHGDPVTIGDTEESPLLIQGNLVVGR